MRAGQGITRQPGTVQFSAQALLDLLQLFAQLRHVTHALTGSKAQQYRQRCFQGMAEITQGIARALERIFGMGKQMIDLRHQRLQLHRHLSIELLARALL
ncbi:hypothetical protein D3C86_1973160 [compost metagenome]